MVKNRHLAEDDHVKGAFQRPDEGRSPELGAPIGTPKRDRSGGECSQTFTEAVTEGTTLYSTEALRYETCQRVCMQTRSEAE